MRKKKKGKTTKVKKYKQGKITHSILLPDPTIYGGKKHPPSQENIVE